ncbi:MAG: DMT family transporter [Desulfobacterales bacterium]|nr:DMT family transporter [Desulfobacterales bacterium]
MGNIMLKSDMLLFLTSFIWGLGFVAQRAGMDYVGPFTFNSIRFALGSLVLLPLILLRKNPQISRLNLQPFMTFKLKLLSGILAGLVLFAAASFQQMGLVYTTAGNAGFITGLYVVIVPILGLTFRQYTNPGTWIGAFLAAAGLYLLCVTEKLAVSLGDFLVLVGAFLWAAHVLIIGWLSPKIESLQLACIQFAVCSILSLIAAVLSEIITLQDIYLAAIPILYGGLISVGIAYTLQVVAQKNTHPAHAAILLSLESVFAALGGWLILDETFTTRGMLGCALMLAGMLLSQLWGVLLKPRFLVNQNNLNSSLRK